MLKIKYLLPLIFILLTFTLMGYCIEYGPDVLTGGTPTASDTHDTSTPAKACDDDEGTYWQSNIAPDDFPHWWKYDLGEAVTKVVQKVRIKPYLHYFKDFTIRGSNNDADWDTLHTDQHADTDEWEDYVFSNSTAYRYYMIHMTVNWVPNLWALIYEIEMMEEIEEEAVTNVMFLFSDF